MTRSSDLLGGPARGTASCAEACTVPACPLGAFSPRLPALRGAAGLGQGRVSDHLRRRPGPQHGRWARAALPAGGLRPPHRSRLPARTPRACWNRTVGSSRRVEQSGQTFGSNSRIKPSDRTVGSNSRIEQSDRAVGSNSRIEQSSPLLRRAQGVSRRQGADLRRAGSALPARGVNGLTQAPQMRSALVSRSPGPPHGIFLNPETLNQAPQMRSALAFPRAVRRGFAKPYTLNPKP